MRIIENHITLSILSILYNELTFDNIDIYSSKLSLFGYDLEAQELVSLDFETFDQIIENYTNNFKPDFNQ